MGLVVSVEKFELAVLDLMNVRYLVATGKSSEQLRLSPKFRFIESLPGNDLFENLTVMPRFFLVHRAIAAASPTEARQLIERGVIDFRKAALTEEPVALTPAIEPSFEKVSVIDYQPNSLHLSVQSTGTSLLVMSETWYPGSRKPGSTTSRLEFLRRSRLSRRCGSGRDTFRSDGVPARDPADFDCGFGAYRARAGGPCMEGPFGKAVIQTRRLLYCSPSRINQV